MGLSARQLAIELGVSHTAVNKASARGRLGRQADGSFDLEKARVEWQVNVNPHQQKRGLSALPPRPGEQPVVAAMAAPVTASASGPLWEQPQSEQPSPAGESSNLVSVEFERAKVKLRHEELKLGEYEKTLVKSDEVRTAQEARANAEREALLNWPSRIAGELAAELGVDERILYAALDVRVRDYLRDRSRTPIPEQRENV